MCKLKLTCHPVLPVHHPQCPRGDSQKGVAPLDKTVSATTREHSCRQETGRSLFPISAGLTAHTPYGKPASRSQSSRGRWNGRGRRSLLNLEASQHEDVRTHPHRKNPFPEARDGGSPSLSLTLPCGQHFTMVLLTTSNRFSAGTARCKHLCERLADWWCMTPVHANFHHQALLARLHEVQQERDSLAHQLKISNNHVRQVFSCYKSF